MLSKPRTHPKPSTLHPTWPSKRQCCRTTWAEPKPKTLNHRASDPRAFSFSRLHQFPKNKRHPFLAKRTYKRSIPKPQSLPAETAERKLIAWVQIASPYCCISS